MYVLMEVDGRNIKCKEEERHYDDEHHDHNVVVEVGQVYDFVHASCDKETKKSLWDQMVRHLSTKINHSV